MKIIKNELISSITVSFIVTILTYFNVPKQHFVSKDQHFKLLIKTFILAFFTTFAIFYFIADEKKSDSIYKNIIQGDPGF
jgi:uncharacterized membrane protein